MNKLETLYGNQNIQSIPSLRSLKKFDKEKGVFIYKRPYKPDEHPNDHSDTINR